MNKFTIEYLITTSANIYFWVYISFSIFQLLYGFTDEYKENKELIKKLGKYPLGFTVNNFIFIFLFILSIYYK
jgi:hypothetical protein